MARRRGADSALQPPAGRGCGGGSVQPRARVAGYGRIYVGGAGNTPAPDTPWSQGSSPEQVVRFEATVPVALSGDAYFIVEAGAKLAPAPGPPAFVDEIVPGMVPIAFTNPIFVDLAGDGFDPPGVPVME